MPTDEIKRPAAWRVQEILKITRETLIGLTYVDYEGGSSTLEHKTLFVVACCDQVRVLDLFLTGSLHERNLELDIKGAMGVLANVSWRVTLSDQHSVLVIRKPTKADQEYLYLDSPTRQVAFRWTLIDTTSSQPKEFHLREDILP